MSTRHRTSARVREKRKQQHAETEHRAARRAPTFRDVFQLPEGPCWLAGWVLGERHGFLLRPLGELEASERDVFLSFAAFKDEMMYDKIAGEWRER